MEFKPFTRAHAREAAEIHIEGQPATFLTGLGIEFLTRLYALFAESPHAFGFVAMDGHTVAGVGIVALDTAQLFGTIKHHYWHQLICPVAWQMLRHPALIGQLIQSLRYPNSLKPLPEEAEVLFFGLRHSYMRLGIGPHMLDYLLDETFQRGAPRLSATIEKHNRPVRWMIANRPGLRVDQEIVLNGRPMLVYRAELPLGVDREPPVPQAP